jgi:hypothetical protein
LRAARRRPTTRQTGLGQDACYGAMVDVQLASNGADAPFFDMGHGAELRLAVKVGTVPASPNSRASYRVQCSFPQWPQFLRAPGPVGMWTTQERCPHTHRRKNSTNTFKKGIGKFVRSARSSAAHYATLSSPAGPAAIFPRILTAIHKRHGCAPADGLWPL